MAKLYQPVRDNSLKKFVPQAGQFSIMTNNAPRDNEKPPKFLKIGKKKDQ